MMSDKNKAESKLSPAMVEDEAAEKMKKRLQDLGLIVNAGADKDSEQIDKKKDDKK